MPLHLRGLPIPPETLAAIRKTLRRPGIEFAHDKKPGVRDGDTQVTPVY